MSLDKIRVWPYSDLDMARMTIKSTYSLDVETVRKLERMAGRLGITKSEALRRAICAAAESLSSEQHETVMALRELQRSLDLSSTASSDWVRRTRDERRSSSQRREAGNG